MEGTAGGFAVAAGLLLGAGGTELPRLRALGAVYGIAGQIANVAALARAQRCQLPETLLAQNGLSGDHVRHDPRCAAPVLRELADIGLQRYRAASGPMPRRLLAAALPAVLGQRDLRRGAYRRLLPDTLAVLAAMTFARL